MGVKSCVLFAVALCLFCYPLESLSVNQLLMHDYDKAHLKGLENIIKIEECSNCLWTELFNPEVSISDVDKWEFAFNYSVAKWRKYRPKWLAGIACAASPDVRVQNVNECLKEFQDAAVLDFYDILNHIERIDHSVRQIANQEQMQRLAMQAQQLSGQISHIQTHVLTSQRSHLERMEELSQRTTGLSAKVTNALAEAEPAINMIDKIDQLRISVDEIIQQFYHSNHLARGASHKGSQGLRLLLRTYSPIKVVLYIVILQLVGYLHSYVVGIVLNLIMMPATGPKRKSTSDFVLSLLFWMRMGESVRALLFLHTMPITMQSLLIVAVVVPIILLGATLIGIFGKGLTSHKEKGSIENGQEEKDQEDQGEKMPSSPLPPMIAVAPSPVCPRIYRHGRYAETQRDAQHERAQTLKRRLSFKASLRG